MAKKPTVTSILTTYDLNQQAVNTNFTNIVEAFDNTLSRDGSSPNQMLADIDLNSNDLLNVNTLGVQTTTTQNLTSTAITTDKLTIGDKLIIPDELASVNANFLDLIDTPSSYTSQGDKIVKVNTAANALEFNTISELNLLQPDTPAPVDLTENWTVSGDWTISGNPSISGNLSLSGGVSNTGTWAYTKSVPVVTTGSSNAYVAALSISTLVAGMEFNLILNHENTGNVTVDIGSGATSVQYYNGTTLSQIPSNAWQVGVSVTIVYDGTRFIWKNPGPYADHTSSLSWRIDPLSRTLECWGESPLSSSKGRSSITFPKTFSVAPKVFTNWNGSDLTNPRVNFAYNILTTGATLRMYTVDANANPPGDLIVDPTPGVIITWNAIGEWDGSS